MIVETQSPAGNRKFFSLRYGAPIILAELCARKRTDKLNEAEGRTQSAGLSIPVSCTIGSRRRAEAYLTDAPLGSSNLTATEEPNTAFCQVAAMHGRAYKSPAGEPTRLLVRPGGRPQPPRPGRRAAGRS